MICVFLGAVDNNIKIPGGGGTPPIKKWKKNPSHYPPQKKKPYSKKYVLWV